MIYNVFVHDFNEGKIKLHNIFNHHGIMEDLELLKTSRKLYIGNLPDGYENKDYKANEVRKDKNLLKAYLQTTFMYYYWGKCEWETVITTWGHYITPEEADKIAEARKEQKYHYAVDLEVGEKIDVWNQIEMNFDAVVDIVWREFLNKK